ncbi:MAG: DUF4395 domain-containing protein [Actinobacteria bacterium]|nr:DUF4395 domain-containing protein [Actinomycetota bacterium]
MTSPAPGPGQPAGTVDPRQPRFGAAITAVLLLIGVYLSLTGISTRSDLGASSPLQRVADPGFLVLLLVAALFAWSLISARRHPFAGLFRTAVRPRLAPPSDWEDARPPRFAQGVGLFVTGVGLILHLVAVPWALPIAGAAAFLAAFLNAAFGFCLGCELYLLLVRAGVIRTGRGRPAVTVPKG